MKILVAVDGSEPSRRAAQYALELARATGAQVTAVHSVVPLWFPGEIEAPLAEESLHEEEQRGASVLASVLDELGGPPEFTTLEVVGPPAERIAEVAERQAFDLVVMGDTGRGFAARLLLGSVTDRVLQLCTRPVMVVH